MSPEEIALQLLANHNCWNCKYLKDMMLEAIEVEDFKCTIKKPWIKMPDDLVCEKWEKDDRNNEIDYNSVWTAMKKHNSRRHI